MARNRKRRHQSLLLEPLEDRTLLTTYVVTTFLDQPVVNIFGLTLREAILKSNADARATPTTRDTIKFDLTGFDGKQLTNPDILLKSALPRITAPVLIDGATQPGGVTLDGRRVANGDGLYLETGYSIIQGMSIVNFKGGSGIVIDGSQGTLPGGRLGLGQNTIRNDSIGILNNIVPAGNAIGITIIGSSQNRIGGAMSFQGGKYIPSNVIGSNTDQGILVKSSLVAVKTLTPVSLWVVSFLPAFLGNWRSCAVVGLIG